MANCLRFEEAMYYQSKTLPFPSPDYDRGITGPLTWAFLIHLPAYPVFVTCLK